MAFYQQVPISISKLRRANPNLKISYCENEGLKAAIELIGEYRGEISGKTAYKRGLNYLSQNLRVKGGKVSKSEIKRLIRPNCRWLHLLILPSRANEILEGIANYVDYPDNGSPHIICRGYNRAFLGKKNVYLCYHYLIDGLLKQLNLIVGGLKSDSNFYQIAQGLINNQRICY